MIEIIEGYAYDYDEKCFTLYRVGMREKGVYGKPNEKSGEMVEFKETLGYYDKLSVMCNAVLNIETKRAAQNAGVKKIGDYLEIMKQVAEKIRNAVDITAF